MLLHTYIPCWGALRMQIDMSIGDSFSVKIESKGDGALDLHDDAPIITYLQTNELSIGLTPKGQGCVVHRAK
jgi:hypothetical protein